MPERRNLPKTSAASKSKKRPNNYFANPKASTLEFVHSGCALLDCVLGGGWAVNRISNVIGDKSTGKSLIAIEAMVNFHQQYPEGRICYAEAEAAFDQEYAQALGAPIDKIDFPEGIDTVEDWYNHLWKTLDENDGKEPVLYVLDSLDALSDVAEQGREIDAGTYGGEKAKQLSVMFRKLVRKMSKKRVTLMVISQIRDNIGVTFGRKHNRSGGHALDFYSSQTLWLAHKGMVKKTRKKVERVTGVDIKAKCDKNKVGLPHRECDFMIEFGYGINDVNANLEWLMSVDQAENAGITGINKNNMKTKLASMSDEEFHKLQRKAHKGVKKIWPEVEQAFLPKRSKY